MIGSRSLTAEPLPSGRQNGDTAPMPSYNLQPNEVMVLTEAGVAHGGTFAAYTDELILTSLNLVLIKKGMFGNGKGIRIFPLKEVKVYNGQAQAMVGRKTNGGAVLDVYFLNGQERFDFRSGKTKTIHNWVANINQVVTGQEIPDGRGPGAALMALPGADLVAGVLKDRLGLFKAMSEPNKQSPARRGALVKAGGQCPACGAPVTGSQGQAATCEYCGTVLQL